LEIFLSISAIKLYFQDPGKYALIGAAATLGELLLKSLIKEKNQNKWIKF